MNGAVTSQRRHIGATQCRQAAVTVAPAGLVTPSGRHSTGVSRTAETAQKRPRAFIEYKHRRELLDLARLWLNASDERIMLIDDAKERTKLLV